MWFGFGASDQRFSGQGRQRWHARRDDALEKFSKTEDGDVVGLELTELDPEVQEALDSLGIEVQGLLSEEDMQDAAEAMEPNSSAAVLVWENVWARKVTQAMRNAGGELVAFERVPHEVVQAAREWVVEQANA